MRLLVSTGLALGVLMIAAPMPAMAQEDDSTQVQTDEDDSYDPDAVRCESRPVTGSRARRERICMTNAQWEEIRRGGNRDANRLIDDGTRIGVRGN